MSSVQVREWSRFAGWAPRGGVDSAAAHRPIAPKLMTQRRRPRPGFAASGLFRTLTRSCRCVVATYDGGTTDMTVVSCVRDGGRLLARGQWPSDFARRIWHSSEVAVARCTRRGRPIGPLLPVRARVLAPPGERAAEAALRAAAGPIARLRLRLARLRRAELLYVALIPESGPSRRRAQRRSSLPILFVAAAVALAATGLGPAAARASSHISTAGCQEHQAFMDGDAAAVAARLPNRFSAELDPSSGRPLVFARAIHCDQLTIDGSTGPATRGSFGIVIQPPDGRGCGSGVPGIGSIAGAEPPLCNWFPVF